MSEKDKEQDLDSDEQHSDVPDEVPTEEIPDDEVPDDEVPAEVAPEEVVPTHRPSWTPCDRNWTSVFACSVRCPRE